MREAGSARRSERTILRRRHALAATAAVLGLFLAPALALGHPLGNFTINHYSGVQVSAERIVIDQVIDMAEVPAFQERASIDANDDGRVSDGEAATWQATRCQALATELRLRVAGAAVLPSTTGSAVSFPLGQLGQPTLRLVCEFTAGLPAPIRGGARLELADDSFPARLGWREITAIGDGVTLSGDVPTTSVSRRLTAYPDDLLAQPLAVASISLVVSPGGAALPAALAPELAAAGEARPGSPAAVPGGIAELGPEVSGILQADALTPPVVIAALAIAASLGALHALTPGHGKTIMAAYLVGTRGDVRQAVGLGLTVAVSHTLGVLLLALVTTALASVIPAERINPILGLVSALLVLGIGFWLLAGVLRQVRGGVAAARTGDAHEHGPGHDHEHPSDPSADGWHAHGTFRHSHLQPPTAGRPSWRGIFALGLAGGLVPSTSALFLLLGSLSLGRPAYGLVLIVAFGAGMALVMTGIGITLVHARRLVDRLPAIVRPARLGGLASGAAAVFVLAAGAWLTSQAVLAIAT